MKIQDIIVLPVDDGIINKTVNNATLIPQHYNLIFFIST